MKTSGKPKVAIATESTRNDAVMQVLEYLRDDVLSVITGRVLIKPNFLSSTDQRVSTHADAVRALLSFLRENGIADVVIAEGGSRSTLQAVEKFGYMSLANDYGVECVDLNHQDYPQSFDTITTNGKSQTVNYIDPRSLADTVISLPVAKTHDSAMVTLSIKNMMGCLRRVHRPRMHGIELSNHLSSTAEWMWNTIEGHPLVIKSFSGIVFTVVNKLRSGLTTRPPAENTALIRQIGAMSENIARMAEVLMPNIAIIDAFEALEGDGPGSAGKQIQLKTVVAGLDPVACDAVMAHIMGFDPMSVGYLRLLNERGAGIADLSNIEIIGESLSSVNKSCVPHKNYSAQLEWEKGLGLCR